MKSQKAAVMSLETDGTLTRPIDDTSDTSNSTKVMDVQQTKNMKGPILGHPSSDFESITTSVDNIEYGRLD